MRIAKAILLALISAGGVVVMVFLIVGGLELLTPLALSGILGHVFVIVGILWGLLVVIIGSVLTVGVMAWATDL